MGVKRALYEIQEPSTAFVSEVELWTLGGKLTLRYAYDRDGKIYRSSLRFSGVRAHMHRAEGHCTAGDVQDAYDTLVEVEDSAWIAELRAAQSSPRIPWVMHHYSIYLDSSGCYNVAAEAWEALPEEAGLASPLG